MKEKQATGGALAAFSGVGAWLLPAWGCPVCLAAFAGTMSAIGFGFVATRAFLTPLTVALLLVTLAALAFSARRQRRHGPLLLGSVSAALLVASKFWVERSWLGHLGLACLLAASLWNARSAARRLPSARNESGPEPTQGARDGYEANR